MTAIGAPMNTQGRVVIPAAIRREMGLQGAVDLIFRYENGTLTVETIEDAVAYVQSVVARQVGSDTSLAESLISQRQAEVTSEW